MTKILTNKSSTNIDYPICRPSLDLDFTQEVLDPRITFTRGSIGTRVNRNRLIETISANQPRFDYDPVTGECKGLLIEESRTNNILYSNRLDTSYSIAVSGGSGTFIDGERVTSSINNVDAIYDASLSTASTFILRNYVSGQPFGTLTGLTSGATRTINSNTFIGQTNNVSAFLTTETTAPDGTNNAVLVTPTTAGSQLRTIIKRFTTSTAGTYTYSVFFKNKNITNDRVAIYIGNQTSASNVVANFTLSTKTFAGGVGQNGGWTGTAGYQDYGNGWGRIWVTATTTAGSHTFLDGSFWLGGYQGTYTSVGSLYAWGAQVEAGAFPTSYIPTTNAQVTRSADLASITGTNFSSWYNQSEGTIFTSSTPNTNSNTGVTGSALGVACFHDGTDTNRIRFATTSTGFLGTVWITSNITQASLTSGTLSSGKTFKISSSYKTNDFRFSRDGGSISSDINGVLPTITQLNIGRSASAIGHFIGTISRLSYYPRALKPLQLQLLTQ